MRLLAALCLGLLLAPVAAANEPIWTRDQRQAERDAVFAGRVVSTTRLDEAVPPALPEAVEGEPREEVWVARVEMLDVRKGHPLLELPAVDLYYVRPAEPRVTGRAPAYVELAPGDERLFFADAAPGPVGGGEALFVDLRSDAIAGIPTSPGIGLRLVTGEWRVWSWAFSKLSDEGYGIELSLSGRVQSENLAPADRWQLTADGTLELLSEAGWVSFRFRPQQRESVFAHTISEGIAAGQVIWLGPAGSDFEELSRHPTVEESATLDLEGGAVEMEEVEVRCPTCGEVNQVELEWSFSGELVQDCWVCCRPIHLRVWRDEWGDPQVRAEREGD